MQWTVLCLSALFATALAFKVGIVSGPGDDISGELWRSLNLEPVNHRVTWWNAIDVAVAVCSLAQNGVQALVMVGPTRLSPLIATYAAHMQLPLVSTGSGSNIVPDASRAVASFIQEMKWHSFVFIYQTDMGADQLQSVLRHLDDTPHIEAFLRTNGVAETLEFVKNLSLTRLLLSTTEFLADELVSKLATLRRSYEVLLLTPVATVQKTVNPGSYRLIKFSIIDEDSMSLFKKNWQTSKRYPFQKEFPDSLILSHDAGKVLQNLLPDAAASHPLQNNLDCFNYSTQFPKNVLNQVHVKEALTGEISFSPKGERSGYKLTIYEERPFQLKKIGWWDEETGLHLSPIDYQKPPTYAAFQDNSQSPIRVTSVLVKPFLFLNTAGTLEGYVVDFLEELKAVTQLQYRIQLVRDGGYGRVTQGSWNGMIGELVRNEADIAVAPLTKTRDRAKVVDFSKNFMSFGLNILLKKPESTETIESGPLMFLSVWYVELWLVFLLSALVYGALCFLISRLVGAPDRVRAIESKGTDNLSPCGSAWFTVASFLQRDTGIYPRTFTHRMWSIVWWMFCFLLAAGYVSSLSAFLIQTRKSVTTLYSKKTSQEVIQDFLEKGTPNIGTLKSGSTVQFFLNSDIGVYGDLGRYLEKNQGNLMNNYDEGAQRVRDSGGSYAFIMESASSHFHANILPCDVVVSSGYLTTKSHAVALQKNSPYKEMIDHGVLVLMEGGTLRKLYEKWWHNNSSSCEDPNRNLLPKVYNKSLTLPEASGAFYVFILFGFVSIVAAFVQNYISAKQISLD